MLNKHIMIQPMERKNFSFSNAEDYIIKYMKNYVEYQKLVKLKGIKLLLSIKYFIKREHYILKNNINYN